jgi:hypothetical protein
MGKMCVYVFAGCWIVDPIRLLGLLGFSVLLCLPGSAQINRTLVKSFPVDQSVALEFDLFEADLAIQHGQAGVVKIYAITNSISGDKADEQAEFDVANSELLFERRENLIRIASKKNGTTKARFKVSYRVETPLETQLNCKIKRGSLAVIGLEGPVQAEMVDGKIDISHVIKDVRATAQSGEVVIDAVSAPVHASVGNGNITVSRAPMETITETGSGDITLLVVGAATASVEDGSGRITVGGARGPLQLVTKYGQIHVKGDAHGDWQLKTLSGDIQVELPSNAHFDIDAITKSGKILAQRNNIEASSLAGQELHQKVNGGGKTIQLSTNGGRITIR